MNAKEGLKKGCRKQNGDWKGARKAREGNAKGQKTEPETEMRRGRDDQAERKERRKERKETCLGLRRSSSPMACRRTGLHGVDRSAIHNTLTVHND